jgi:hypothetical protein
MKTKIECPICGANIVHRRVDDGFDSHIIKRDGTVVAVVSKSNGFEILYDEFMCSHNTDHHLTQELEIACMDLIAEYCQSKKD